MELLRKLLGPGKDEIWSQLSAEIGAEYQKDGFFKNGKVVLSHGEWEIILDTYTVHTGKSSVTYTRMRAPFINKDGFRFNIYRKSIFSWLGRLLGVKDIEIGDSFFDEQFIIQGKPENLVQRLLMNSEIKRLIQNQPNIHFQIKDDEGRFAKSFPEGVDELYFEALGIITDKQRLKELFDLFTSVLDGLCNMGSAYEKDPGVRVN
jgi:hypothetical protein